MEIEDFDGLLVSESKNYKRDLLTRLKLGTSLRLDDKLDLLFGINKGYFSYGVSFELFLLDIAVSYYTIDKGINFSDPIDFLSIKFSLLSN